MRKIIVFLFLLILLSIFFTTEANAQVVINEVSPVSDPEWVELYNVSSDTVILEEYAIYFDDNASTTQKYEFCGGEQISGNTFKLITRPVGAFWLANNGDGLVLKKAGVVVDSVTYGSGKEVEIPKADQSISRVPEGGSSWAIIDTPSPQGEDIIMVCPTPSPTESPTQTPIPTASPTPVVTESPTPKPTVLAVATQKPTMTPRPVRKDSEEDGEDVLGLRDGLVASPTPSSDGEIKKKFPFVAGIFLFGGSGLIGVAGYTFLKNGKKEYNKKGKEKESDGFNKITFKRNDNKESS